MPEAPIREVTLRNVRFVYKGGGRPHGGGPVPLLADAYPEPSMFGRTPAWGLWVRDADNVLLESLKLETETPDARPESVSERATIRRRP